MDPCALFMVASLVLSREPDTQAMTNNYLLDKLMKWEGRRCVMPGTHSEGERLKEDKVQDTESENR